MGPVAEVMGPVYVVGAGLGEPYLTVRGRELLATAEAIVCDDLVDRAVLRWAPQARVHWVGKRGGQPSTTQEEINALLVDLAQRGQRVVRLKGGDPGVFGRLTAELAALQAAGLTWELVPGISSAIGGPLLAGVPLTDRDRPAVAIVTATALETLPWEALAQMPTVVVLMGGNSAWPARLLAAGKPPTTPVTLLRDVGGPRYRVWESTLGAIATETAGEDLSPLVAVVGAQPAFPPALPLTGQTVLVTRGVEQGGELTQRLQDLGARILEMPTLAVLPPSTWEPCDRAIAALGSFDWLWFASVNGVRAFWERLTHHGWDSRALAGLKIAVVGRQTAQVLTTYGLRADFIPADFTADCLAETLPLGPGQRVLFPRVESGGRTTALQRLQARGGHIETVPVYESGCPAAVEPAIVTALQAQEIQTITFTSSKTVQHFAQLLDGVAPRSEWQKWLQATAIAAIGPSTAETCQKVLGRVDCVAQEFTVAGLVQALVDRVAKA
ncbi:MAG: uroporphyrinogen-III C-methyltransferase [Pseudanabaenaceae cyanobacterium]